MAWKKSKDGGLDYDTTLETRYKKAKYDLENAEFEQQLTPREKLQKFRATKHREFAQKNHGCGVKRIEKKIRRRIG